MKNKKLFSYMFLKDGKSVTGLRKYQLLLDGDAVKLAAAYEENGADGLVIFDLSSNDEEHEKNLNVIRSIGRSVDIPILGGGNINRLEDVKKLLYAGCSCAFLNMSKDSNVAMVKEASQRFGKEKTAVCINDFAAISESADMLRQYASVALLFGDSRHIYEAVNVLPMDTIPLFSEMDYSRMGALLRLENVAGISGALMSRPDISLEHLRKEMAAMGIPISCFGSDYAWSDFKTNSDGLLPVIVQDYKTKQVLMMAYMNEEAFQNTLLTGKMTYFSRSRQKLWVKGETSGHYQIVKQLSLDCDNDTLLARVSQIGAACHTGSKSCFYRDIVSAQYRERHPGSVFEDVMAVIHDRKLHPKEGSYTNYLFDKGIDKILKKLGEEATEIVIAAKNPNPEEIKYEICDFLYHMMVLMEERGVTWEDITEELAKR
ncbi:MAG: bifunctional phosphoribosyl-AMP cyclohydrolase/phosphoribosyl-ATP diphosphatase HisIE [Eubacteriales bacterium]|nr:bifunctional phosphoribosyl-AMP cyclohydrolase/phosphoribosyl-ATP diphosphatase HisIE [Eubacteriales bacterium]